MQKQRNQTTSENCIRTQAAFGVTWKMVVKIKWVVGEREEGEPMWIYCVPGMCARRWRGSLTHCTSSLYENPSQSHTQAYICENPPEAWSRNVDIDRFAGKQFLHHSLQLQSGSCWQSSYLSHLEKQQGFSPALRCIHSRLQSGLNIGLLSTNLKSVHANYTLN